MREHHSLQRFPRPGPSKETTTLETIDFAFGRAHESFRKVFEPEDKLWTSPEMLEKHVNFIALNLQAAKVSYQDENVERFSFDRLEPHGQRVSVGTLSNIIFTRTMDVTGQNFTQCLHNESIEYKLSDGGRQMTTPREALRGRLQDFVKEWITDIEVLLEPGRRVCINLEELGFEFLYLDAMLQSAAREIKDDTRDVKNTQNPLESTSVDYGAKDPVYTSHLTSTLHLIEESRLMIQDMESLPRMFWDSRKASINTIMTLDSLLQELNKPGGIQYDPAKDEQQLESLMKRLETKARASLEIGLMSLLQYLVTLGEGASED